MSRASKYAIELPLPKRVKHNSSNDSKNTHTDDREDSPQMPTDSILAASSGKDTTPKGEQHNVVKADSKWYGGTWPRTPVKAAPITQLATEGISIGGEVTAKGVAKAKSIAGSIKSSSRPSSLHMSPGISSRALPAAASTSRVNVSMPKSGSSSSQDAMDIDETQRNSEESGAAGNNVPTGSNKQTMPSSDPNSRAGTPSSTWTGWIPGYRSAQSQAPPQAPIARGDGSAPGETKTDVVLKTKDAKQLADQPMMENMVGVEDTSGQTSDQSAQAQSLTSRPRSWFGLWNGDADAKAVSTSDTQDLSIKSSDLGVSSSSHTKMESSDRDAKNQKLLGVKVDNDPNSEAQPNTTKDQSAPTSWSFWPRGGQQTMRPPEKPNAGTEKTTRSHVQSKEDELKAAMTSEAVKSLSASRKRERTESVELPSGTREDQISKKSPDGKTSATAAIDVLPAGSDEKPPPQKRESGNLLLPSLKQTLRAADNPGLLSRLASYFYSSKALPNRHVNLISDPPKIKHALAIGVHGYFPAPLLRTVIGQPRGTSVRFASNAEEAIAEWSRKHNCNPKIDKIALEGEGKIEERVELLWQLLLKHIDKIQEADFILVACHSQGVPVAVQLVAKLIGFGCLNSARVGICAMAGINQGPFAEYKSRWIGGSAGELFDFASPSSKVSSDYEVALNTVLKSGIKVVLVGSIDDQLVSMESATFGNAEHPCLFRAVFINGQVHAPTFLVHLVGFALKLRNLGIPDHGLIRELSNSLSGSFTGDGHSKLYEDPQLYDIAVEFTLETTPFPNESLLLRKGPSTSSQNPYILPFAMRGVLEEDFVRSELHSEILELLKQFDDWKPTTKPLKDVKFRLEGVRSKI